MFVTEDTYERTLMVDGEKTTLIVMDTWENDKLVQQHLSPLQIFSLITKTHNASLPNDEVIQQWVSVRDIFGI